MQRCGCFVHFVHIFLLLQPVVQKPASGELHKKYNCSGSLDGLPYCMYTVGDCRSRIIINAPHGGTLRPPDIPVRIGGCLVDGKCDWRYFCEPKNVKKCEGIVEVSNDDKTRHIAKIIVDKLTKEMGGLRPHFIQNNLHRSRIDLNRPLYESTYHYPVMMTTFKEYHRLIRKARSKIQGPGVFIEIHGHYGQPKSNPLIILGYNVVMKHLMNKTLTNADHLSIRSLAKRSKYTLENIVRGDKSLGKILGENGYKKNIPSPFIPNAQRVPGYYRGGMNIRKYGSLKGGEIDAVQIEIHKEYNTEAESIAEAVAKSIKEWTGIHYNEDDLRKQDCPDDDSTE
jgi:hypothetical protein